MPIIMPNDWVKRKVIKPPTSLVSQNPAQIDPVKHGWKSSESRQGILHDFPIKTYIL